MSTSHAGIAHCAECAATEDRPTGVERIRILHSVGRLDRGGIENWVYHIIQRMDRRRFEHHVLVRTEADEPFTAQFREAGIRVLPCIGVTSPIAFRRNFIRLLRENGPYDVLHAHGFSMLTTQVLLHGRLAGIPLRIMHSHDDLRPALKCSSALYKAYVRASLSVIRSLANRGLACGAQAAEWVFGENSRSLHPSLLIGIDMEPCFKPPDPELRARLRIPAGRFVLLQVGRLEIQKNHAFTVEIARGLAARGFPFHLLLVGDGMLREKILRALYAAGLNDCVTWIASSKEVPQLMRSIADLMLLPSHHEGLPLVHLESQAAGVPMLISDQVTREAVIDPELVDFLPITQGPEIWTERIIARMKNGKRSTLSAAHRNRFTESRFNIDRCAAELAVIYASAQRRPHRSTQEIATR